jgi:hypothetical protein
MKAEFVAYLDSLEATDQVLTRVETILNFYKDLCPEDILDIFISEYIKKDGNREYQSLWLFSKRFMMEAKNFLIQDDFDIAPINNFVTYGDIQKNEYDFNTTSEGSRLFFKFSITDVVNGELKASKGNCNFLKAIILKYFMPNMRA